MDEAIEDAERIVRIASIALLEPVDEGGAGQIGGDAGGKCAVPEAAAEHAVRKRLVRRPDMLMSVVPVDGRVVPREGVHDVGIELKALVS